MALKKLFGFAGKAKTADTKNEAGGKAYAFTPAHALAQYASTGTMHNTFYASAETQLATILELAEKCAPEFVAKTAIYARQHGFMKDVPALLVAYLAKKDVALMKAAFPHVIDNGKMLRNFVQIVRSGQVGRKSFGTAPKRAAQAWFRDRTPENIFRNSLGQDPSMSDVIKMVRPSPKNGEGGIDAVREALYGYLIGKNVDAEKLPGVVRDFEKFKADKGEVPAVPFELLTALELDKDHWTSIAKTMSWTQTRMNLNTLLRKGVFEDRKTVKIVAERLRTPNAIKKARVFPYQLLAAFKAAGADMPGAITNALQDALEIATENVPSLSGKVVFCPDVSGSMSSPVTGHRKGATSAVRCVDVASLVAASFLRRCPDVDIIPFSDHVVPLPRRLNPRDSVMTNAQYLASLPSGGTSCSAPLRYMNQMNAEADLVVYVSDNQSWSDFGSAATRSTPMAEEWERFRKRNPNAKLVLIDIQPYAHTQVADRADVLNVGGFSDSVFEIVSLFAKGEMSGARFVSAIESVKL